MGRPKKEDSSNDAGEAYSAYVHGESVNAIAERLKLDVQEVLGMITNIEQNRKPETN